MAKKYQTGAKKSHPNFEVMDGKEVAVRLPLPLVEVWEQLQTEVEHRTGMAGLKIIKAVIEDEVRRRVGPRYHPDPASRCVRWGIAGPVGRLRYLVGWGYIVNQHENTWNAVYRGPFPLR